MACAFHLKAGWVGSWVPPTQVEPRTDGAVSLLLRAGDSRHELLHALVGRVVTVEDTRDDVVHGVLDRSARRVPMGQGSEQGFLGHGLLDVGDRLFAAIVEGGI